jgi:hypothetical protein
LLAVLLFAANRLSFIILCVLEMLGFVPGEFAGCESAGLLGMVKCGRCGSVGGDAGSMNWRCWLSCLVSDVGLCCAWVYGVFGERREDSYIWVYLPS